MKTMAQSRISWFILWITFGLWFTPAAGFTDESSRRMDVVCEQHERDVGSPGRRPVQEERTGSRARAYSIDIARDSNVVGRRTGVHVHGRSHLGAGNAQGRRRCYHRRGRQPFGVFLYRSSGDQELQ